uniref:Uncharacterized protein n=1 Tax=Arundo donax TaxID=35708 RepID=A0A0A9G9Q6_ARUDO
MSSSSEGRFFRIYSSVSSSQSAISFSFNANAGKIAESRSEEKCGETSRHPGPVSKTREITSNASEKIRLGRESSLLILMLCFDILIAQLTICGICSSACFR